MTTTAPAESRYIDPIEARAALEAHGEDCPYRLSVLCPVPVECEHGVDFCPTCDACDCRP